MLVAAMTYQSGFNPRAPGGARSYQAGGVIVDDEFQSTRPRRGAMTLGELQSFADQVSIHAPPEGRDSRPLSVPA